MTRTIASVLATRSIWNAQIEVVHNENKLNEIMFEILKD
ncbi:hypothetical protein NTGBS_1180007 [Candidatus Nitrotoga sp. BS]|nr:hypothetical protein NTGBS_1180007 [Candidatus Nitrotoga sp. BS]